MIPTTKRRRKRRAPRQPQQQQNEDPNQLQEPSGTTLRKVKKPLSLLDDTTLNFLDYQGDSLDHQKPISHSLPFLLDQRRLGTVPRSQQRRWQQKTLQTFTEKPKDAEHRRRQWRPYCHRRIPFTKLSTPRNEAVLALERSASYVLTLGSAASATNEEEPGEASLALAIRFYGTQ